MVDAPDDLGIPMKPSRPIGTVSVTQVGRSPAAVPPRVPEMARPPAEPPRAAEGPRRPVTEPIPVPVAPPPLAAAPPPLPAAQARRSETGLRQLTVGREISLSGEIASCDTLIVEGSVEANLQNCRDVDIAETGLFKGSAEIDNADVRGIFEGSLVVRKRLLIRAGGQVSGTIRYGQIEIELGGQIAGDVQANAAAGDVITELPNARAAS
ncbi:MAG TPA: polymer-forming cytoskeletal protein [Stellaceae bacterium]|nr:polymer-forming cytoskeletal protein [Stellaceae bacterium]